MKKNVDIDLILEMKNDINKQFEFLNREINPLGVFCKNEVLEKISNIEYIIQFYKFKIK